MNSLLSFLLLSSFGLGAGHTRCRSSSCGELRISDPFRLKGDPAYCGLQQYQLVCDGNKTILDLNPGKYYVTEISYNDSTFSAGTLQVVDDSLASGNCGLPPHSLSYSMLEGAGYYSAGQLWASFVNCTRMIKNDMYLPVSCLTGNNTFVYVIVSESAYELRFLEPFCAYSAMFPITAAPINNSALEVIKLFQKGFTLICMSDRSISLHACLRDAKSMFYEQSSSNRILSQISALVYGAMYFLGCLTYYFSESMTFGIAAALVILLLIMQLLMVLALLGRCVCAPLAVYLFLAYKFWSTRVSIDIVEKFLRNQRTLTPTRYAYTDIIAITNHFKEKLGQGGFGSVFKGKLAGGHLVAVKMLGNSKCNGEEFINEVSTIGRIHHVNIVQLVGFCSEGSKRALVYECMPNGSLDKYIFSSNRTGARPFTLERLHKIALGVARGIDYLHRGCDVQILHFDIKPHNILLGHDFAPKVSDFGLAKLYPKDYSLLPRSAARGTIGYIAPELISRSFGVISHKADVYSFGMLLMEMAGGRRNADPRPGCSSQDYYPSWIYDKLIHEGELKIDNSFEISNVERKLCMVGLWCIQMRSCDRPSISEVVEMLEADVDSLKIPPKPFLSPEEPISVAYSHQDSSSTELSIIPEHE
ncbi:rust resistance kinase Lr10-like [Phoenix dactylifera]|uniref:Rust resistance kinase Lr10-like n=1 Tax=Phoenix dactylifera TaxID=42345 RepID=A0A8B9A8Q7_PHODC|nr:rust resistance kinase Lr10-like [Phoenix dactylifera]